MLRVLHSVSNMDRAGIETMLMNYYRYIDRSKIQFDFLCNKSKIGAYDEEIRSMGGRIFRSPGLNPINWFKYEKYVKKILDENPEIKIVHSHNGAFSLQAQLAAKKNGIRNRIIHVHGTKIDFNLKLPLKLLYKKFLKLSGNNYWGCGIDAIEYYFGKRNELKQKYSLENKFVRGNVARFTKQKNHIFSLNLFKLILEKKPNSVLLLCGDGELLDEMKIKVKELGIYNSVMFMGNINKVNEMYQVMDIFLLPSLFEGLPVVGIEAQCSGLKCFMSDTITNEVAITENVKFLSLKNDSLEKWSNEIIKSSDYKRKDMTQEIIKAGYSIEIEARKLQEIYLKMGEC